MREGGVAAQLSLTKGKGQWTMTTDLIQDRGRGPEIAGTRITVYDLLPYFLDAAATEAYICRLYELSPEQVAAARAYVLNNLESILAEHLKIEARMAAGNPPEVIEQAKKTHAAFLSFKQWLAQRDKTAAAGGDGCVCARKRDDRSRTFSHVPPVACPAGVAAGGAAVTCKDCWPTKTSRATCCTFADCSVASSCGPLERQGSHAVSSRTFMP